MEAPAPIAEEVAAPDAAAPEAKAPARAAVAQPPAARASLEAGYQKWLDSPGAR